jgi:hypothetical protein
MESVAAFFYNSSFNTKVTTNIFSPSKKLSDTAKSSIIEKSNEIFSKYSEESKVFLHDINLDIKENLKKTGLCVVEIYGKYDSDSNELSINNSETTLYSQISNKEINFINLAEFINVAGNFLCFSILKILKIFYYNVNIQKSVYQAKVFRTDSSNPFYSKSIPLTSKITLNKVENTSKLTDMQWIKSKVKNALAITAWTIVSLALSVFILLGITLKLLALIDTSIRKDYKFLKEFLTPKNVEIGSFEKPIECKDFGTSPIDKAKNLDPKNTIFNTLTIYIKQCNSIGLSSSLSKKSHNNNTTIDDIPSIKKLVLIIQNTNSYIQDMKIIDSYKFSRFCCKYTSSILKHPDFTTTIIFEKPTY